MVDQLNAAKNSDPSDAEASSTPISPEVIESPAPVTAVPRKAASVPPSLFALYDRFHRLNLRTKATAIAIAIGTLPVLGIGAIAYHLANQSITQQIKDAQEASALTLSQRVTSFMAERQGDMQVISNLPVLTNPTVKENISPEEKKILLQRIVEAYGVYDNIAVFDVNGNVQYQSNSDTIPGQADQAYFKTALDSDKVAFSRPVRQDLTGPYVIYLTAPILDSVSNKKVGIVRAVLPIQNLATQLRDYGKNNIEFSILDSSNQIFVSSSEADTGQLATSAYSNFAAMQSRRSLNSRVTEAIEPTGRRTVLATYIPWLGRENLPDLGWDTVMSIPTEIAFAPQRQLLLTVLLGTGAIAVLTGLLATWLANRATQPILKATRAVKQLGDGKLETRLSVQGDDELSQLGNNINQMAGQLQTLIAQQTRNAQQSQILTRIVVNIRRSLSFDDILKTGVEEVRHFLACDRVVIYRFNPDYLSGTITAESVAPGWIKALGSIVDDPLRPGVVDRFRDGNVVTMDDISTADITKCHCEILERLEVKANIVAPILRNQELIGLICGHQCSGPRYWEPGEIDLFRQLAAQIGYALDQAALLEQTEAARQQAEQLSEERRQQKEELQLQLINLLGEVEGAVAGDLTVRADVTAGEIGTVADFFNSIVESLRQIVTQVKDAAMQVNSSLGNDEQAIRQLSEEAVRQANETSRTLSSVQLMVQSIQTVSSSARQAADVARSASATAESGGVAMDLTVQNILKLRETIGETAKKVKRLGESSQQISKVVSLINQIATQTNLLAINAGIEAARAGEDSQGFAVVAEEVGELAARSAAATREIEQIVATIQRETSEVVEAMEQGTSQVVEGTRLVDNAKQSLEQILSVSRKIDDLVRSISDATVSQVETSQAVTHLMQDIVQAAGRTSESSLSVSQSIRQTVDIAKQLQESVGTFKVS